MDALDKLEESFHCWLYDINRQYSNKVFGIFILVMFK